MNSKRWQDGFIIYIGIYLLCSPFIMGFRAELPARSWSFFLAGIVCIALAATALRQGIRWPSLANIFVGLWMIVSPWILGFSEFVSARNDAISLGVMIGLIALWSYRAEGEREGAISVAR